MGFHNVFRGFYGVSEWFQGNFRKVSGGDGDLGLQRVPGEFQ